MSFTVPNTAAAAFPPQAGLDSGDLAILAAGPGLTGVVSGCAVTAQGTPNMTVAVAAGVARIGGRRVTVAGGNVTITAANGTNPRHDLITVDTSGALAAVAGTPAAVTTTSEPVFPAIPANRTVLAAVYVPAASATVPSNQIVDKRVLVADPGVENVKWYGALGDGTTDDTAAIQAAISASVVGSTVLFPLGTYIISASIRLVAGRAYVGAGHGFGGQGATIKQKNGANISEAAGISGLLVADAWYANATFCDNPILVQNLYIDGNKANNPSSNACGIIIMNYWTIVDRCQVAAAPLHGIHLTDVGRNGTTVISNSASENRILYCRIDSPNGHGISQVSQNNNSNQDGYCEGNIIVSPVLNGLNFTRAAGWVFRRNHFYGVQYSAIDMAGGYATVIDSNYIEGFGSGAIGGATYVGISLTQLGGRGSTITNNLIANDDTLAGVAAFRYIVVSAGSGQDADMIVANNHITGNNGANGTGLYAQTTGGGGILHVRATGNVTRFIAKPTVTSGNATTSAGTSVASDYVIYTSAGTTYAVNGSTGYTDYSGTDSAAVLQSAITALGAGGGTITFKAGAYTWSSVPALRPNTTGWVKLIGEPGTKITLSTAGSRFLDFGKVADGDLFNFIHIEGFTIDAAALSAYNFSTHIVLGTWQGGSANVSGTNVSMDHIVIRRIRTLNVRTDATDTYWHLSIWLVLYTSNNTTQRKLTNVLVEDCEFNGGAYGVAIAGQPDSTLGAGLDPNIWIDHVRVQDIYHDTGLVGAVGTHAHIQLGSGALGGTAWIGRLHGKNSGDVGIEVDNFQTCYINDIVLENYFGFGVLATNFATLADPKSQSYYLTDVTGYQTSTAGWSGDANSLFGLSQNHNRAGTLVPFGRLIAKNVQLYRKGASLDGPGITGDLAGIIGPATEVLIHGARYQATGLTHTGAGTPSYTVVYTNPTSKTRVSLRDIDIRMDGTFGVGSANAFTTPLWLGGFLNLFVDNVAIDVQFTNVAAGSVHGIDLGSFVPSTITGAIRNYRISTNDTGAKGILVYDTGRLAITNQILFDNLDFTGLVSGSTDIQWGDTTNKIKTLARNMKWRVYPMAPYTLTAPTSATAAQFTEGFDAVLQITGGTVTVVAVSRNNSTFYQVAAGTNVAVPIQQGDYYRITYSVAPTITVMPAK